MLDHAVHRLKPRPHPARNTATAPAPLPAASDLSSGLHDSTDASPDANRKLPTCAPRELVGCHRNTLPSVAADASRKPRDWYASAVRLDSSSWPSIICG